MNCVALCFSEAVCKAMKKEGNSSYEQLMWFNLWSFSFNAAKPMFLPLKIIHLFIVHYDSATKH